VCSSCPASPEFPDVVPAPRQRPGIASTLAELVREPSPESHGPTAYRDRRRAEQINMVPRDDSLAGWCFAQFHVGEGIRRDVAPPNPEIKETSRRPHDRIGPRESRRLVGFGSIFCNSR